MCKLNLQCVIELTFFTVSAFSEPSVKVTTLAGASVDLRSMIDAQGLVQFNYVNPNYKVRLHELLLLKAAELV